MYCGTDIKALLWPWRLKDCAVTVVVYRVLVLKRYIRRRHNIQ